MNKVNVSFPTFRIAVPAATLAGAPVEIRLAPICPALHELHLWCTSAPVLASSGWRMISRGGQIIPDNGSDEDGITFLEHEADWAPLPNTRARVGMADRLLDGPPYEVVFQFYSTAAIEVGGLLVTHDLQHGIPDLVRELKRWQEKIDARANNGPTQHTEE